MDLIAVDPGVHFCAAAWFRASTLYKVELRTERLPESLHACVCELPNQRGRNTTVRMSTIIDLTLAAGRMTGAYECKYVTPSKWKKQVPCTCGPRVVVEECVHHRRMVKVLSAAELTLVKSAPITAGLLHNIYDAVSLGLVTLGRM